VLRIVQLAAAFSDGERRCKARTMIPAALRSAALLLLGIYIHHVFDGGSQERFGCNALGLGRALYRVNPVIDERQQQRP
jgi:hypothetical protein